MVRISADGHYITFSSYASDLTGTTDANRNTPDIFDNLIGAAALIRSLRLGEQ